MKLFKSLAATLVAMMVTVTIHLGAQSAVSPPGERRPTPAGKPRIPPVPENQRTDQQRQVAAKYPNAREIDRGFDTLLQLPALADAVMPYTIYLSDQSTLSSRHRGLLVLRSAWLSGNPVVWSTHAARAGASGLTPREIRRIAEGPDTQGWDPLEATLLRLADELYRNSSVSDATWKALSAKYDLLNLVDAVETVNHFTMVSMLYNAFGVQTTAAATDRLPTDVTYRVVVPQREPPLKTARVEPNPGDGIAVGRTFGRHAKLNQARAPRANFINRVSKLMPRHREMFILRIGWDCQSEYEWSQHVGTVGRARDHGLEPRMIADGPAAAGWDPFERQILRAVDELYTGATISDATWAALAARYDMELMMSAVFTASSYRATSMALNAFGVQHEPGDERFPQLLTR
jgi:alkylhydroperoxidase family enzyme